MKPLFPQLQATRRLLQTTGPYLLLELLLPGGTLFALLLWWYRRKGGRATVTVSKERIGRLFGGLGGVTRRIEAPFDGYAWTRRVARSCGRGDDGLEALGFVPGCNTARASTPARALAARDAGCTVGAGGCAAPA